MSSISEAVLITGGTKRLGYQIALKTLKMGYSVIIHYRNDSGINLQSLFPPEYKNRVYFIQQELQTEPENLIKIAASHPVTLCGLVNNASIFETGNLADIDHLKKILNINSLIPAILANAFTTTVNNGWIINITDANIRTPNSRFQNYRISKLILEELTKQLAFLYAPKFRVNAIAPGAMLPATHEDQQYFKQLAEKIPLQSTGDISSLVDAYEFLVKTPYITGEIIHIDGGWHLTN
ncbi:MAG: SDR family oxidoreductase [Fibrobacter sp.]|nr:SDR family oxidoreductase [Fibrobacter sp.]